MAVSYLKNNPDQLKKMDKYLGDMSKTLKRTAKSFKALNKKDITYDNSKKIFKDNFLNKDSFYKNLSKQVDNKIAINYKNGIARDLIDYKNFKLKINKSINNEIIKTATNEVMSKTNVTHERYKDQLDIFYSKVLKNQSEFFRKANAKEAINKQFNLVSIYEKFKDKLPRDIVPFARDPFGDMICFDYRISKIPSIVFWRVDKGKSEESIDFICDTFSDLLSSLYRVEEELA